MLLLIDNYDSFTFNLRDYFLQLGEEVLVVENDQVNEHSIHTLSFDKVVLSPGPNKPEDSGNLMGLLPVVVERFPVLGICLGHQALGQYFGADLQLALRPMHGKVSRITNDGSGVYNQLPCQFDVCRYHSLVVDVHACKELRMTAWSDENECMGFEHVGRPIVGMQYHPEAILTEYGLQLLDNWLSSVRNYRFG